VSDVTWTQREEMGVANLPPTWAAIPAGGASIKIGSDWLASLRSSILMIPSVIVPEERVSRIHPGYPGVSAITAKTFEEIHFIAHRTTGRHLSAAILDS